VKDRYPTDPIHPNIGKLSAAAGEFNLSDVIRAAQCEHEMLRKRVRRRSLNYRARFVATVLSVRPWASRVLAAMRICGCSLPLTSTTLAWRSCAA